MVDQTRKFGKIIDTIQMHGIFTIGDFKKMNRDTRGFYSEVSKNIRFNEFQQEANKLLNKHAGIFKSVQSFEKSSPERTQDSRSVVPRVGKGFIRFVPFSKRPELDALIPHGALTVLRNFSLLFLMGWSLVWKKSTLTGSISTF